MRDQGAPLFTNLNTVLQYLHYNTEGKNENADHSSSLGKSSSSTSERSISSSEGSSPSLPSHASTELIWGKDAPLTGAVEPRPNERSLQTQKFEYFKN